MVLGLLLVIFTISTQQAALLVPAELDLVATKRSLDSHSRATIPLFRGSNLSMFVRKRPYGSFPERAVNRRHEFSSNTEYDESLFDDVFGFGTDGHLQRRFDEYSENPGPMFG